MSKTLTLVERLRERETAALADAHRSDIAGSGEAASLYDDEARFYDEIAAALEAAQKALEPFAEQANRMDASDLRMGESKREDSWEYWVKTGDLRLARTVYSMLMGNENER